MKARADKHRREVVYSPGDMVMLSMKNMRHGGPGVKKLCPLIMGPFEVDHMVEGPEPHDGRPGRK